jgi:hypothetical protein
MQDSVKWSLAVVRTPNGWVGRYDTYGPNGKTVHIPVVPAAAQYADELIFTVQEEKRQANLQKVRQLTPFVKWDDQGAWEGWQEEDYENWLEEVETGDLDEEEQLEMFHYFWGNMED